MPIAWSEQLAASGIALATLSMSSPSWPGLAVVARTAGGRVRARLEAVRLGHRAGHGWSQLYLKPGLLGRIEAADGGSTRTTGTGPPPEEARGLWLALDHLHPGLVRNRAGDHLVIGAPECGSWVTARPDGSGRWTVTVCGPRDIWAEVQDTTTRWQAAGSPPSYELHLDPDGTQWAGVGRGSAELSWQLPAAVEPQGSVPARDPEPTQPKMESAP
ncbi:hypothetical protein ACIA8H_32000 [Streptomyces goshikiensis]|uniref:hypothetical protein n=1 Tax=Streptomyces goshikiensis TaxID=1942 RepID=UPI00378E67C4